MSQYGLRFRLRSDLDDPVARDSQARLFDVLDSAGVAEDVSPIDGSGSYNLWLTVSAAGPEEALRSAIQHLIEAEHVVRGVGIDRSTLAFLSAEIELEKPEDAPAVDGSWLTPI